MAVLAVPYVAVFMWGIFDLQSNFFVRAFIRNKAEQKTIGLTFDDGPDENLTTDILLTCSSVSGFTRPFLWWENGRRRIRK